jgi:glycine betaine/choline ABC-type transport system substrate-binding protein
MSPILLDRRDVLRLAAGGTLALAGCRSARADTLIVGSKNFTEQIVLGELLAQQIEAHTALRADRRFDLGGTLLCHQALLAGQMDLYPEYTGTALTVILKEPPASDPARRLSNRPRRLQKPVRPRCRAAAGFQQHFRHRGARR